MEKTDLKYTFQIEEASRLLLKIWRCDGADRMHIPIDAGNPEYCKFLDWIANKPVSPPSTYQNLIPGARYICDEEELYRICRDSGIMLAVAHRGDGSTQLRTDPAQLGGASIILTHGGNPAPAHGSLHRLHKSVQAESVGVILARDHLGSVALPIFVTEPLWQRLNQLITDDSSDVRKLSSWPVERTFVYVDISEFSQQPPAHQALIINALIRMVNDRSLWENLLDKPWEDLEARLCIGDGYIFVFRTARIAVNFAGFLAMLIESQVGKRLVPEFHFRIGVHTGEVYRFWDYDHWNYTGSGIIKGQRVISAIGKEQDDVVFVSSDTRQRILVEKHGHFLASQMVNRGSRRDKHGERHRLYELNHVSVMGGSTE